MKKQKRTEEIYAAALRLFADYGFKKTTMEDVARELDITKGALYIYVEDKKDLYQKTVGWALLKWQNRSGKPRQLK
jgi:AcrR family transcriptional regulator